MNFNQIKFGKPVTYLDGVVNYLKGAMIWGFRSKFKWGDTSTDIWGFANPNDIDPESQVVYDRIIADGGVSDLTRLNYFVVGLKTIYGTLANVPVCYDAHWIGYKLGSGTGATAGQAAAKLYSLTVAGDAVQATAASQPLLLAHNGASSDNYWYGSGVVGNYVSSTITYATSTIEMEATFSLNATTGQPNIVSGGNGTNSSFFFFYDLSASAIVFQYYTSGFKSAFALTSFTNLDTFYVLRNSVTGAITFKKNGITLTTLNSQVAGVLDYSITQVKIGEGNSKVNRVKMFIAGAPVVDFNPATYNASTSQTAWTSATGEVWTINTGTAATGYKGVLVDRTIVQSDGVDDKMTSSVITAISDRTNYIAVKTNENSGYVIDDINTLAANGVLLRTLPGIGIITNAATVTEASAVNRTLKLSTTKLSTLTQGSAINNGTEVTGVVVGSQTTDGVMVFANGNGGSYSNTNINTLIISNSADNATNRTAMYNLIRSLNNNAF